MSESNVVTAVVLDRDHIPTFKQMVDEDNFAGAVEFGRKSRNKYVNDRAEELAVGNYYRRWDKQWIPPQPGEGSMLYFWHLFATKGNKFAYEWISGVKTLAKFKQAWDDGRAKKPDGSRLGSIVQKSGPVADGGAAFAAARQKRHERAERHRADHQGKHGTSGGGKEKRRKG